MEAKEDRRVVAVNVLRPTSATSKGAKAFVVLPNDGNANDRIELLIRSRGGRWIERWEAAKNLANARAVTIPPQHPLYGRERLWSVTAPAPGTASPKEAP